MKWIRWEVATPDHPIVHELAARLGCAPVKALGHYTALCCRVGEHREAGAIQDVPDSLLEHWGQWEGKRGRFAEVIREVCQEEDGRIKGWWRQDKLLERAIKARERSQKNREQSANGSHTEIERSHPRARARAPSRPVVVDEQTIPIWETVRGALPESSHPALDAVLGMADEHRAVLCELKAMADGQRGRPVPWAVIGRGMEELWAAGGSWSPRRLQVFCRKIAEGGDPAPSGGLGNIRRAS